MKSKLVWVSVALIIATIILWVVLINRVNDDVSKLSAAIKNSIAEAAETDSLRQARLDYQFDPEKRGSFAKRFEELHENTRVWFVDEGLWQIRYAEAESWSRQLWVRALETMYSTVLSATMKDEARTRELVENMVEVTFYDYRPKRTRTVNRVIKEFGYMGEEVTEFITTTIDF
ncbi:hypothetical protein KKG41_00395, partial [Patescibacteria group bacterium]|nr:hypothetical protein [Patescibacteria group bacterium]MBU1890952.1 hypothetical protein [Patescibacteria group bacterium]